MIFSVMVIFIIIDGWCSHKELGLAFGMVGLASSQEPSKTTPVQADCTCSELPWLSRGGSWINLRLGNCPFGLHFPAPLFLALWLHTQLCPVSEPQFPNSQWETMSSYPIGWRGPQRDGASTVLGAQVAMAVIPGTQAHMLSALLHGPSCLICWTVSPRKD